MQDRHNPRSFRTNDDQDTYVHFLTYSCYKRLPLLKSSRLKNLFIDHLDREREKLNYQLYAYVIMPDHIHLLISSHDIPISRVQQGIKGGFSILALEIMRNINTPELGSLQYRHGKRIITSFWMPGGGFDEPIMDIDSLLTRIRYIHENPMRNGIVIDPIDWIWSSARFYEGYSDTRLRMDELPFI